jgi:hypothetical protein
VINGLVDSIPTALSPVRGDRSNDRRCDGSSFRSRSQSPVKAVADSVLEIVLYYRYMGPEPPPV